MRLRVWAVAALSFSATLVAQEDPHAFTGARILTITGGEIENGTMLVQRGKIVAVGTAVAVPADATVHDLAGRILMPGLVDTHSHVGQGAGADGSAPIQPEVRVLDSINVRHSGIQKAQAGGITTANVMPGSGHLLSGQTVYLKLRDGATVEDLAIRLADGSIAGGMKMANGTNSRKDAAVSRLHAASRPRWCASSTSRRRNTAASATTRRSPADKRPARDLAMEGLCEVLSGRRVVHHHTHRHDDIVTVLRLAEEFGFRVVLHHVSEGWKVADEIARAKVPASIILIDSPGGKLEAVDLAIRNRRRSREGRRPHRLPHGRSDHRLAPLPALGGDGCARRPVAPDRPRGVDDQRREDARPRGAHRLARDGKGRRLHRPGRRSAERLHQGARDLGRRREESSTAAIREIT